MDASSLHLMAKVQEDYWWYKIRRKAVINLLNEYKGLPVKGRWLDAGCGPGTNVQLFNDYGELYGIDASDVCVSYAKEAVKEATFIKTVVEELPFEDNYFEIITALDIIEHTKDDVKALKSLYRVLDSDGIIIITVPAYQWLRSAFDDYVYHYRRYNKKMLHNAVEQAGFKILHSSYLFLTLFPITVTLRKIFTPRTLSEEKRKDFKYIPELPKFVNETFYYLTLWETQWIKKRSLPYGSSFVLVATK